MPTKWRSYRDHRLCDVTSPCALDHGVRAAARGAERKMTANSDFPRRAQCKHIEIGIGRRRVASGLNAPLAF